jgi:1-acyl-sn-glycerol-3-phosphate acyltransferase
MKRFAKLLTKLVFIFLYRVELINAEKVPTQGSVILCANHNGMLDMFFIGYKLKRWIYWMGKEELFHNPIAGFIFRKLGVFPVKRGKGDVGSIKTAFKLLQDGKIIGMFPQGTRAKAKSTSPLRIKSGAAMLAIKSGAKILPVAVHGSHRPFSRISVIFGDVFSVDADVDKKYTNEELSEISKDIMNRVYSLMEA